MFIAILGVAFAFGVIIFLHEFGHYLMAKKLKVKVEKFSFGFGPEIIGKTINETRYSLCLIPLGGYVKLTGENPEELTGQPHEYFSRPWYERIYIALTGPLMNYFFAFLVFFLVIYIWGTLKISKEPVIGKLIKNMPAEKSGLLPGDRIISIDSNPINTWSEMANIIHNSKNKTLKIEVKRGEVSFYVNITPKYDTTIGKSFIGISPVTFIERPTFLNAIYQAANLILFIPLTTIKYLIDRIIKLEQPELAGPIGVAGLIIESTKKGISSFLHMVAVISTAIAFFNILPIPILDGGHILLSFIECISKRKPSIKLIRISNAIGLTILLFLIILATGQDIRRIFLK